MAMAERVVRLAESFAPDPDYRISVDAVVEHHRIDFNGVTIADSDEVLVLHETRLEPTYYFPKAHVRMDLMEATDHGTFCPFKGNASYWTLRVGERSAENALWGYEEPFPEVHEIGGYVSFYRDRMDAWFVDGKPLDGLDRSAPQTEPSGIEENPFVDWLLREAWDATTTRELVRRFADALNEAGLSVMRMNVVIPTLHPLLVAHSYRWSRDSGEVVRNAASNETFESRQYRASPLPVIFEGEGGIRRWVDAESINDFPILKDLYEAGATEYVAMPVRFSDGQINALTMATDRPDGFTTEALGHVHEIIPLLSRLFEVHAKARTAATLLETFVGKHTGQRVLNGSIKRGDGEDIHAVIWFCDMRQSTPLAETLSRREFLDHLTGSSTAWRAPSSTMAARCCGSSAMRCLRSFRSAPTRPRVARTPAPSVTPASAPYPRLSMRRRGSPTSTKRSKRKASRPSISASASISGKSPTATSASPNASNSRWSVRRRTRRRASRP